MKTITYALIFNNFLTFQTKNGNFGSAHVEQMLWNNNAITARGWRDCHCLALRRIVAIVAPASQLQNRHFPQATQRDTWHTVALGARVSLTWDHHHVTVVLTLCIAAHHLQRDPTSHLLLVVRGPRVGVPALHWLRALLRQRLCTLQGRFRDSGHCLRLFVLRVRWVNPKTGTCQKLCEKCIQHNQYVHIVTAFSCFYSSCSAVCHCDAVP
jgi:hypothetical protein